MSLRSISSGFIYNFTSMLNKFKLKISDKLIRIILMSEVSVTFPSKKEEVWNHFMTWQHKNYTRSTQFRWRPYAITDGLVLVTIPSYYKSSYIGTIAL